MPDSSRQAEVEVSGVPVDRRGRAVRLLLVASVIFVAVSAVHYYTDAPEKIPEPVLRVKARHILVKSEKEAKRILDEILGGTPFEDLARKHSKDPRSGSKGGDLGWFSRGDMVPPFEKACFEAELGLLREPVKSEHGFHVIEIIEKSDKPAPRLPSFGR